MLPNARPLPHPKCTNLIPHPCCSLPFHQPPLRSPALRVLPKYLLILLRHATTCAQYCALRPPTSTDLGAAFRHDPRDGVPKQRMNAKAFVDDRDEVGKGRGFLVGNGGRKSTVGRYLVEFAMQAGERRRVGGEVVEDGGEGYGDGVVARDPAQWK